MIAFSYHKLYYFLFFTAVYGFLSFWISIMYFFDMKPLFWGGIVFYVFAYGMQKVALGVQNDAVPNAGKTFFIIFGLFAALYIAAVYGLQQLIITQTDITSDIFRVVNWSLVLFGFALSFISSFKYEAISRGKNYGKNR